MIYTRILTDIVRPRPPKDRFKQKNAFRWNSYTTDTSQYIKLTQPTRHDILTHSNDTVPRCPAIVPTPPSTLQKPELYQERQPSRKELEERVDRQTRTRTRTGRENLGGWNAREQ